MKAAQPRAQARGTGGVRYRIVVKGRLSDALGSAFQDMLLEPGTGSTAITGRFDDQAELHGVLDRLRHFGIELVSINPIEEAGR